MHWKLLMPIFLAVTALFSCGKLIVIRIAPPGNYDLTSKSITYSPNPIKVGDEVIFTYTVDNLGKSDVPARTYEVDFYVNGRRVSFDESTSQIFAGLKTTYSKAEGYYHFKATKTGIYTYKLVIDPYNSLKETDETNNVIDGEFEVIK